MKGRLSADAGPASLRFREKRLNVSLDIFSINNSGVSGRDPSIPVYQKRVRHISDYVIESPPPLTGVRGRNSSKPLKLNRRRRHLIY
jgi:hypothetical protein